MLGFSKSVERSTWRTLCKNAGKIKKEKGVFSVINSQEMIHGEDRVTRKELLEHSQVWRLAGRRVKPADHDVFPFSMAELLYVIKMINA